VAPVVWWLDRASFAVFVGALRAVSADLPRVTHTLVDCGGQQDKVRIRNGSPLQEQGSRVHRADVRVV